MTKEIIFLRHGETNYNVEDRMQGQLDTELSVNGRQQIKHTANLLAAYRPERIFTSDLTRARETAEAIGILTGIRPIVDKKLRETHLGKWQGLTKAELDLLYPGEREIWSSDPTYPPPEGESKIQVAERFAEFWETVNEKQLNSGLTIIVTHGGFIAAAVTKLLNTGIDSWGIFSGLSNASWGHLKQNSTDSTWKIQTWNPLFTNLSGSL